ncbi:MAG: hypothetical protein AB2374_11910 [Cytobacillus gottheilii]|uniref:hypothetical protein n=1 Tax=Cytobacillus gottheilii TaxID=859144 RepID=UPI003463EF3E
MTNSYRINVFGDKLHSKVVARVKYNETLDYWDGHNWTNGGVGRHLGITKLKDGRYVLIFGTQWQGENDYGVIVSPEKALNEILISNNSELLNMKRFADLKILAEEIGIMGDSQNEVD